MGKSLNRDERKNSKYIRWDEERRRKEGRYNAEPQVKRTAPKKKWRPHSEIDAD